MRSRIIGAWALALVLSSGGLSGQAIAEPTGPGDIDELPECAPKAEARSRIPAPPVASAPRSAFCRAEPTRMVEPPTGLDRGAQSAGAGAGAQVASQYFHQGWQSTQEFTGIMARLQVTNPGVRHTGDPYEQEFFASRIMVKQTFGQENRWLEAGWTEFGGAGQPRDTRQVYTLNTVEGGWKFYPQYQLRDRRYYEFYISSYALGGDYEWVAFLNWNGQWQILDRVVLPGVGDTAFVENFHEIYIGDWPRVEWYLPPTRTRDVRVAKPGTGFQLWTPTFADAIPTGVRAGSYCTTYTAQWNDHTTRTC